MRNSTLFTASLACSAAIAALFTAVSANATHSWAGMHWARTGTLNIRYADNVSPAWDSYLATASVDWTKSAPIDTTVIQGYRNPYYCNGTYGRVEVCSSQYGTTGWLGIAQVWTSYGHIIAGIVAVNDTYFAYSKYNSPAWRHEVMCQEIGHTLGLDHQDEIKTNANLGTCMDYTSDPSGTLGTNGVLSNEHPNAHDYQELVTIYSHNDGWQLSSTRPPTTALASPNSLAEQSSSSHFPRSADPVSNSRLWGRALKLDRAGRGRIFGRSLGNGLEQTTFVTWTDSYDR
jgi:hypothetical protein